MAALPRIPAPKPIDDFEGWLSAFTQPTVLVEVLVLAVCLMLAWGVVVLRAGVWAGAMTGPSGLVGGMWMGSCFRWYCCAWGLLPAWHWKMSSALPC
jgi:hypothetical protein